MRFAALVAGALILGSILAVWLARALPGRGAPYYRESTRAEREAEETAERAWSGYSV